MWNWLVQTLRSYPEIAIFLALGLGFWLGKLRFGKFSLGVVTSTLLAGVLVGQLEISISGNVKSTFFLMFLFAVGYGVGPQFFGSLKGDGLPQVLFSIVQCVVVLVVAIVVGRLLGYDADTGKYLMQDIFARRLKLWGKETESLQTDKNSYAGQQKAFLDDIKSKKEESFKPWEK